MIYLAASLVAFVFVVVLAIELGEVAKGLKEVAKAINNLKR